MLRITFVLLGWMALGCDAVPPALIRPADAGVPEPAADHAPRATTMAGALAAAGLDVAQLPALDDVDDAKLPAVMATFTQALGLACSDCHAQDYTADTPRKRIARKMWDRMVRGLRFGDGSAIYCDSCHQGAATFLDRRDPSPDGTLAHWMQAAYVTPLQGSDGASAGCASCHGTPFVPDFLRQWALPDEPDDLGAPSDGGGGPPDLGAGSGCEALLVCLDGCAAGDATCTRRCRARASTVAKALLKAAQQCCINDCEKSGRCKSGSDDSPDCNACFSNASSGGVTGVACVPANDPSCGDCAAEWYACEAN